MKNHLSLGDFIKEVESELVKAQKTEREAFYEPTEVNLEVSIFLDMSAKDGEKLFVLDKDGEAESVHSYRATIRLEPVRRIPLGREDPRQPFPHHGGPFGGPGFGPFGGPGGGPFEGPGGGPFRGPGRGPFGGPGGSSPGAP